MAPWFDRVAHVVGRVVCLSFVVLEVAAAGALTGCGRSPSEKLAGKWVGDRVDSAPDGRNARANEWVRGNTWEFSGDKVTISIPDQAPRSGTFKVTRADGAKLTLAIARSDTHAVDEAVVQLEGDRALHWNIGDGREVVLVRAAD